MAVMGGRARDAVKNFGHAMPDQKNKALLESASALRLNAPKLLAANDQDMGLAEKRQVAP